MPLTHNLLVWSFIFTSVWSLASYAEKQAEPVGSRSSKVEIHDHCTNGLFARTELFFGTSKPDGSMVSDEEFRRFLDEVITPRFPEGLTAMSGTGQFRSSSGMVIRENSVFVILLYPSDEEGSSARIEEIRQAYRRAFEQESVLRVDSQSCVSF